MIDGVKIIPLTQIPDERGSVRHMLRADDPWFEKFGEIYFSTVYPGKTKGFHCHKEMTLNYAVIVGTIKLVLWDGRENSPTKGQTYEIYLGQCNYSLVQIPPGIWNGFIGTGTEEAIVANCATLPYSEDEIMRISDLK